MVVEAANEGIDSVTLYSFWLSGGAYTMTTNVEDLRLTTQKVPGSSTYFLVPPGTRGATITGNTSDNKIWGEDTDDHFSGGTGNDRLVGFEGSDTLDGGAGTDTLEGGLGSDTYYVDSLSDVVIEHPIDSSSTDVIRSTVTYSLADNIESLYLDGSLAIDGTGNANHNRLVGNGAANALYGGDGNDTLEGGAGTDTLAGGAGNDTYVVDSTSDVINEIDGEGLDTVSSSMTYTLGANVENLTLAGTVAINGTGNAGDNAITGNSAVNQLFGGAGNDTLNGGSGNDTLSGGSGNDSYIVDSTGDVVTELASEDIDTVEATATYSLGANIENLVLTGTAAINGTGNAAANTLQGNGAANVLDGGSGADTLIGGDGSDTYVVDNLADVVVESATGGTDTIQTSITYTIGNNVENLTLIGSTTINGTGNDLGNSIVGNSGNNVLNGGNGNDTLNGGAGVDTLVGGAGNDTYVLDSTTDVISESLDGGTDLVQIALAYTLTANVENLTLTGTSAVAGTGNELSNVLTGNGAANRLTGNGGNDVLNGGAGADTMLGGVGNDVYFVDATKDVVTENANEGIDLIQSTIAYTLGTNVEALTLEGTGAVNGTGNASNNLLIGNGANNTLNGAGGVDLLQGGDGTDTLTDTSGNNLFDGGVGNDTITGGIGQDFIAGGSGNDSITTNTGADVIAFNLGDGQDIVIASTGKDNTVSLGKGIKYADLSFKKNLNDLVLVTGSTDQITFKDWYRNTSNQSVSTLQILIEETPDYDAGSASNLNNRKIVQFNFDGLATKFDQARASNPSLTVWSMSSSLQEFFIGNSDGAAIGGDMAYQYGRNGNFSTLTMTPAQSLLADAQFGVGNQALQLIGALQDQSPWMI